MHVPVQYEPTIILPSKREIYLQESDETISRTDLNGNILFCNKTLSTLSGYTQKELYKAPHSILRHPDMPKAIFYLIWQKLLAGLTTKALVKNFTKEGDFYWVMLEFSALRDNDYNIISYIAKGTKASNDLVKNIKPLYQAVLDHEQRYGIYSSIMYLSSILEQENVASYSDYLYKLSPKRKNTIFSSLKWKS